MVKHTPSIVDVADRARVSIATASRVMSNSTYPVSLTTRQKVLDAAAELGYTPNTLARSLRSQRSKLIAVMVGDNADPYFAEIMRGVEEVANEHGYLTIVCNSDRNPVKELHYLRTLRDYRADGVIFAGSGLNEAGHNQYLTEIAQEMIERGAAVITLAQHMLSVPSIQADNQGGAHAMTSRLIELGHSRIAFVRGPKNLIVAEARLQGYLTAMQEKGLNVTPALLLKGNFNQSGGEEVARQIVQLPVAERPTAIFAANDATAFGIMLGLTQRGWHLPSDISICGFGNLPMAQLVTPSLTSVNIPVRHLGRSGAIKLLALLRQESTPWLEVIPTTIVERASTAPLLKSAHR